MENTTWRSDCEDFRLQRLDVPVITCSGQTADRAGLAYPHPKAAASSCPRRQRWPIRATSRSTICSRRLRWA